MQERRNTDAQILAELAVLSEQMRAQTARTCRLVEVIEGNGHPGLKTQVDRLEQNGQRHTWYHRLWLTSAAGAAAAWLMGAFRG